MAHGRFSSKRRDDRCPFRFRKRRYHYDRKSPAPPPLDGACMILVGVCRVGGSKDFSTWLSLGYPLIERLLGVDGDWRKGRADRRWVIGALVAGSPICVCSPPATMRTGRATAVTAGSGCKMDPGKWKPRLLCILVVSVTEQRGRNSGTTTPTDPPFRPSLH